MISVRSKTEQHTFNNWVSQIIAVVHTDVVIEHLTVSSFFPKGPLYSVPSLNGKCCHRFVDSPLLSKL